MAEGDDNEEDDDEGDEGEGDEAEGKESADGQQEVTSQPSENQDKEMADIPATVETPAPQPADVEMKDDDTSSKEPTPTNPLTLAPPAASLASGSPKIEGSPLKNVSVASPPAQQVDVAQDSAADAEQPRPSLPAEDSTVAEPPSTIVGEAPEEATERDLPPAEPSNGPDEALLPPPPDQVGNISSPKASSKAESVPEHTSEGGEKAKEETGSEEMIPEKPVHAHQDSVMTEDTIKPDDSASAGIPATVSGAPSEVAPASTEQGLGSTSPADVAQEGGKSEDAGETGEAQEAEVSEAPQGAQPAEEAQEPVQASGPEDDAAAPATNPEPDLLGGLMGELDREASKDETVPPVSEPAQETTDAAPEAVTEPAQDSEAKPAGQPVPEPDPAPVAEPAPEPAEVEPTAVEKPAGQGEQPAEPEAKDSSNAAETTES